MELYHRDLGGAGRPPLVILHGMLGSSRNWLSAGAELAESFHVFALDLRNHGRSPHDATMNYEVLADDVLTWLDTQGVARATLLGHSLGGKVAMRLACRAPERMARLVVVDIAPRDYPEKLDRAEFAAMNALRLEAIASRGDAERAMEPWVPNPLMRKYLTTNLEQDAAGGWRWSINLPALTAAVPELVANPLAPGDRYDGPVRFITGGKSDFVRPDDMAAIRSHFPAAEIVTMEGSGHNPHIEARAEFVRFVSAAVAS
ncbi:MAG: alpha/beta fold hydrolase [Verrucomicrobiota bacterium]